MFDQLLSGWHWLDLTLGAALAIVALNAVRRGFVREAGTLVGIGLGIMAADMFGASIAQGLGPIPAGGAVARIASIGLVAAAITLLVGVARDAVVAPRFSLADRLGGLAVGLAEGATALGLVLYATRVGLGGLATKSVEGSALAPLFMAWWVWISGLLPALLAAPRLLVSYLSVTSA